MAYAIKHARLPTSALFFSTVQSIKMDCKFSCFERFSKNLMESIESSLRATRSSSFSLPLIDQIFIVFGGREGKRFETAILYQVDLAADKVFHIQAISREGQ